jgi:hypothetical protein
MSRRTSTPNAVAQSVLKAKQKEVALEEYTKKHQALQDAHMKKKEMEGIVACWFSYVF